MHFLHYPLTLHFIRYAALKLVTKLTEEFRKSKSFFFQFYRNLNSIITCLKCRDALQNFVYFLVCLFTFISNSMLTRIRYFYQRTIYYFITLCHIRRNLRICTFKLPRQLIISLNRVRIATFSHMYTIPALYFWQ